MNGRGRVTIKLHLQTQVTVQVWPVKCSLLTPTLGGREEIVLHGPLHHAHTRAWAEADLALPSSSILDLLCDLRQVPLSQLLSRSLLGDYLAQYMAKKKV